MEPVTEEQVQGAVVSTAEATQQPETHAAEVGDVFDEEALDGGDEGRPRSQTKRRLIGIRILKNLSLFKRRKRYEDLS